MWDVTVWQCDMSPYKVQNYIYFFIWPCEVCLLWRQEQEGAGGATCAWHSWVTCKGQTFSSTTNSKQLMLDVEPLLSEERERDSGRSSSILSTQTPDTPHSPLHPFPLPHIPSARNMTKLSPICIQACLCLFFLCENFFQRILAPHNPGRVGAGHGLDIGQGDRNTIGYSRICKGLLNL